MRSGKFTVAGALVALAMLALAGCSEEPQDAQPVVRKPVPKKVAEAMPKAADNAVLPKDNVPVYSSVGKRDPFEPFIKPPKPVAPAAALAPDERPTLQNQDLSAFKYVGMLWSRKSIRALLEDGEGRGYTVHVGERVGRAGAIVTKINDKEIVFKEETKDYSGSSIVRETSLKLRSAGGK